MNRLRTARIRPLRPIRDTARSPLGRIRPMTDQTITAASADGLAKADQRETPERRKSLVDRRTGLERRRGPGRRRPDSRRSAEEGELTDEQFAFVMAMDEYKRANKRPFPSWTEVLEVIKYLGYRKVSKVGEHVDKP